MANEPVGTEDEGGVGWIENFAGDGLQEHVRNPEERMEDAEVQAAVEAALRGLPEMERAVLVLYHQEECSYEGIAGALGMPINTVRTHLHRGRKRLLEVLRGRRGTERGAAEREAGEPKGKVERLSGGIVAGRVVEGRP